MIIASIDWLSISINLLLVVFVIVCLLMTLMVMMQRPKQEGLGAAFGGGVTDQVFGAQTTSALQRGTIYLGSAFFIISLLLAVLIGHQNKGESLLKKKGAKVVLEAPTSPVAPAAPKSLAEEIPAEVKPVKEVASPMVPETVIPEITPPTPPVIPAVPAVPEVVPPNN